MGKLDDYDNLKVRNFSENAFGDVEVAWFLPKRLKWSKGGDFEVDRLITSTE